MFYSMLELLCWQCFNNPPNSDMDNKIFNMSTYLFTYMTVSTFFVAENIFFI